MNRTVKLITAVLAATPLVGAGTALAAGGGAGHLSRSPETAMAGVSLSTAAGPESGTFEYQAALETGNLPSDDGRAAVSASRPKTGAQVPAIEIGGMNYRVGIDTP